MVALRSARSVLGAFAASRSGAGMTSVAALSAAMSTRRVGTRVEAVGISGFLKWGRCEPKRAFRPRCASFVYRLVRRGGYGGRRRERSGGGRREQPAVLGRGSGHDRLRSGPLQVTTRLVRDLRDVERDVLGLSA